MSEGIFHIAKAEDWKAAKASGRYEWSTRDATLADVGYIHCSFAAQVAMVANLVYADATEPLVLLRINPAAVTATIQIECIDGAREHFPHIYGPLEVDWVTEVTAFDRNSSGTFEVPPLPAHRHESDNIATIT